MRVQEHIITPRYGGSVIGGIHDHISGAYLLSNNNPFVPKPIALDVLGQIGGLVSCLMRVSLMVSQILWTRVVQSDYPRWIQFAIHQSKPR